MVQAAVFALEGHPTAACNGTYRPRGQHEGWPRFENEHGMHLFRYRPDEEWLLGDAFTPESGDCAGHIAAAEGPIPTGAQRWQIAPKSHNSGSGKWEPRTVTVTALVSALRRCLSSPLGADLLTLAIPKQPHIAETAQWGVSSSSGSYLCLAAGYDIAHTREEGILRAGSARYPVCCCSIAYAFEHL